MSPCYFPCPEENKFFAHTKNKLIMVNLKMASAQVVETSVTNNSPSQDSYHPDDLFHSTYVTPGFKPLS